MSVDILGTNCDQCVCVVQCCFTFTGTVRLIRTGSPGRPPRLSHSSWALYDKEIELSPKLQGVCPWPSLCRSLWRFPHPDKYVIRPHNVGLVPLCRDFYVQRNTPCRDFYLQRNTLCFSLSVPVTPTRDSTKTCQCFVVVLTYVLSRFSWPVQWRVPTDLITVSKCGHGVVGKLTSVIDRNWRQ